MSGSAFPTGMRKNPDNPPRLRAREFSAGNLALLGCLTLVAIAVMGYHPGLEDDSFYLAAIKHNLNPSLFPHDADFFRVQFQATIFDKLIAFSVRLTHLPLAWTILLWQFVAIFFVLHGCWRIARRCFPNAESHWAATALVAALLTIPLPGIAINLADQYLHPRTLATAAIVAAIVAVIDRRLWIAGVLLAFAFAVHAIMACFGISFCVFLWWALRTPPARESLPALVTASLIPLGWIFEPASDAWRQAASTRGFYFLIHWHWYEWLGVFAPLLLLFLFRRFLQSKAEADDDSSLVPVTTALLSYGVFQTIVGLMIMLPPSLERLRPFEPMRYLHLLYLLFFLLAGGFIGRYVLDRRVVSLALAVHPAQRWHVLCSDDRCTRHPSTSNFRGWRRPIRGCKRFVGSRRTRHLMRSSRSIPTTRRCPARTTTDFALWLSAAHSPTTRKTPAWRPASPAWPRAG